MAHRNNEEVKMSQKSTSEPPAASGTRRYGRSGGRRAGDIRRKRRSRACSMACTVIAASRNSGGETALPRACTMLGQLNSSGRVRSDLPATRRATRPASGRDREKHSGASINAVGVLPRRGHATMAEILVNLTVLRNYTSAYARVTVVGPAGVTVLSTGEGVVWFKQKSVGLT